MKREIKEPFCGACVAGITALAGAGASAGSSRVNKKSKKIVFWIGITVTIISIIVMCYLLFIAKCKECA
jgi:hypothetical protein